MPYAWAVEYGSGLSALFKDEAKALLFAAQTQGVLIPLYDLRGSDD